MYRTTILICFFILCFGSIHAQTQDEENEVYKVIIQLFDGMRAGDSVMVRNTFMPEASMYTATYDTKGMSVLHKGSLKSFVKAVGTPHDKVWDEPIWETEIRLEENLAQVWTKYAFFVGDKFSHCGVDAFQLFKTDQGWKIFQITDTRKTEDCNLPEDLIKKRKNDQ